MKKANLTMLEKIFSAEMYNELPFQTKSTKIIKELEDGGYVVPMVVMMGPVRVTGWQMTHLGSITYCEWAAKQPLTDEESNPV